MSILKGGPQAGSSTGIYNVTFFDDTRINYNFNSSTSGEVDSPETDWAITNKITIQNQSIIFQNDELNDFSWVLYYDSNDNYLGFVGEYTGTNNDTYAAQISSDRSVIPSNADSFVVLAAKTNFDTVNPAGISFATFSNITIEYQITQNQNAIQNIYYGSSLVPRAYLGETLVYGQEPPTYIDATGGTILTYEDNGTYYKSHTFTSSGNFVVNSLSNQGASLNELDYLIVAGGGGGGTYSGGGGGAGGYRTTLGTSGGNSTAENKITANEQSYTITVGAGGARGVEPSGFGENGNNTSAFGITSTGGGGGGRTSGGDGQDGGSGGGGSGASSSNFADFGLGIEGQGFNGGQHIGGSTADVAGGGGGGAGQVGGNASTNISGNGGDGLGSIIRNGTTEYRAGGGRGGRDGRYTDNMGSYGLGAENEGGGGQGDDGLGENLNTSGNSGIVIIRYEVGEL